MRPQTLVAAALLLAFAVGCAEDFTPASTVNSLRVLGIRAEPAELHPGETARVSALVMDPSRPGKRNTLVWFSCDPDPLNLGRSACADLGQLGDPTALAGGSSEGEAQLPPGMHLAGFGETAIYAAPADLFSGLPADDARRRSGSVAQLLLMAIAEEVSPAASREELDAVLARVRSREVASVLSIFRVRVSEETTLNQNPILEGISHDGQRVPDGAHLRVRAGDSSPVSVEVPQSAFESDPQGKTEGLIAAWYATEGRFTNDRVALGSERSAVFTAPDEASIPPNRKGRLWTVVRDTRGGQSWLEVPFFVCDAPGPAPVAHMRLEGTNVKLEGQHLDRILDVTVGGRALRDTSFSTLKGTFEGTLPPLESGEHPVVLRLRDCSDIATGQVIRIP